MCQGQNIPSLRIVNTADPYFSLVNKSIRLRHLIFIKLMVKYEKWHKWFQENTNKQINSNKKENKNKMHLWDSNSHLSV